LIEVADPEAFEAFERRLSFRVMLSFLGFGWMAFRAVFSTMSVSRRSFVLLKSPSAGDCLLSEDVYNFLIIDPCGGAERLHAAFFRVPQGLFPEISEDDGVGAAS
jgi:hypothetical protein